MAKTEERRPSMADIAEQVGRHHRSRHLAKDTADGLPMQRILIGVATVVVVAVAVLVWRLVR